MTLSEMIMVAIGGFLGAIIRYIFAMRWNRVDQIPAGTLLANLIGAFLIGIVFGLDLPMTWTFLLASGLAGALTTFSTMNKEFLQLWKRGAKGKAVIYLLVSYLVGIGFAYVGCAFSGSF